MHFPLDISENLHDELKKKNLSNARSVAILFAVRDLNFHLIIFAKFKCSKHFCIFERQLHGHFNTKGKIIETLGTISVSIREI